MEAQGRQFRGKKYIPKVIKEFTDLGGDRTKLKVRIVQYENPYFGVSDPRVDIREYVEGRENTDGTPPFTGFTRKGISLTWDDILLLEELIPQIKEAMEAVPDKGVKKGKK